MTSLLEFLNGSKKTPFSHKQRWDTALRKVAKSNFPAMESSMNPPQGQKRIKKEIWKKIVYVVRLIFFLSFFLQNFQASNLSISIEFSKPLKPTTARSPDVSRLPSLNFFHDYSEKKKLEDSHPTVLNFPKRGLFYLTWQKKVNYLVEKKQSETCFYHLESSTMRPPQE